MLRLSRNHLTVAVATAAAALGGTAVAGAADGSSTATASERAGAGDRPPGGRGPGRGARADLAAVARKLGVTQAELRSAVEAARPAGRPADRGGDRASAIASALGVDTSQVRKILDANRPHRGAGGPPSGRPDEGALVTALADGLSKSEAEVRAALAKAEEEHRSAHDARESAMYSAIAKALGKEAADVKAAFDAVRPAR